jgi:serine/threonine-protein kinase
LSADARRNGAQDRLPRTIGPYVICERIGKGAMGVVYRATDDTGRSEVALKVMASDLDGDPETRERFFREAQVAGKLKHPNIVAVRGSGEDNGRLYIAMELLRGVTLNEVIKEDSALDLEERVDMMIQVCQGLVVAHNAGVFHRDLKPANLFVCEDRRVKILDFGVARLVGSNMTVTGNIIGTPDFMSPEQVRGAEIDGRSDIFSAGSVFYLLLTGRKPFAANDLPAVLNKVVRAQPLPIRDTEAPEPIAAVIRKALAKDPAARQQEVRQLACELMAAATEVARTTKQNALRVRTEAAEMIRLGSRAREAAKALELPDGAARDPWPALQTQYPLLRGGVDVLGIYPFRSRIVQELSDLVHAEAELLKTQVGQLEEAQTKLATGKTLHQKGEHEQALKELDAARRLAGESRAISATLEQCAKAVQKIREREAHVQARLSVATNAAEREDWEGVLAIIKELDEHAVQNAAITRLRDDAHKQLEARRLRQARAAETPPAAPAPAPAMPPRSSGKHAAAAAAGAQESGGADHGASGVRSERTARGTHLRNEAVRSLAAGDLVNAERLAAEAVALHSSDKEAAQLLARVRAAIALRAAHEQNARRVADLLARANAHAAKREFSQALALCDEALEIDPMSVEGLTTRARLADEKAAEEAARTADAARQRRIVAATPALKQARQALQDKDFERARWCAENAVALAPDWAEAQTVLAEILKATPEASPDDTVKLNDSQSDETAELAPLSELPESVVNPSSHRSRWWRSSHAKTKG